MFISKNLGQTAIPTSFENGENPTLTTFLNVSKHDINAFIHFKSSMMFQDGVKCGIMEFMLYFNLIANTVKLNDFKIQYDIDDKNGKCLFSGNVNRPINNNANIELNIDDINTDGINMDDQMGVRKMVLGAQLIILRLVMCLQVSQLQAQLRRLF